MAINYISTGRNAGIRSVNLYFGAKIVMIQLVVPLDLP